MKYVCLPLICALLVSACASSVNNEDAPTPRNPFRPAKEKRMERLDVEQRYRNARASLESADYATAIEQYDEILTKYPFTRFATQAQLESVYAHYRSFEPDTALSAVDQFIREHPRYRSIDYAYYLQGLINYSRSLGALDNYLPIDSTRRDPVYARRAFSDFALLIQRFPTSEYAWDARQRMIHLRNRIAKHELHVAEFYLRREAYVAASRRARDIVEQYQRTDSIPRALEILKASYEGLSLDGQAQQIERLIAANRANFDAARQAPQTVDEQVEPAPPVLPTRSTASGAPGDKAKLRKTGKPAAQALTIERRDSMDEADSSDDAAPEATSSSRNSDSPSRTTGPRKRR